MLRAIYGSLSPKEVLVKFLLFGSFDLFDFAHRDSWQWYLTTSGGLIAEKLFPGPKVGHLTLPQKKVLLACFFPQRDHF